MGQDPSQIRNEIEETRSRMGDTAEALGHKADVPGRAKGAISDRVESVKSTISGSTPDKGDAKQGAQRAAGVAKENPLGLAIGATAVGFIAGMLIPSTRVEDEKIEGQGQGDRPGGSRARQAGGAGDDTQQLTRLDSPKERPRPPTLGGRGVIFAAWANATSMSRAVSPGPT